MTFATRLSTALLVAGLTAVPALAQTVEERVDRTLRFQPGGTLRLKTFSGKVEIRGADGDEVVIHAVRRAKADKLEDIRFDIRAEGSTIVINANEHDDRLKNDNVVEADIEIQVPTRTTLDIKTFSAPVTVRGVDGRHEIGGFSSTIRVEDAVQDVRVKTFSGDVYVAARTWSDGRAIDLDTFSGGIDLRVPQDARTQVAFNTFSGDLDTDVPLTLTRARGRRHVEGSLNGGGTSRVRLKTFSGDARVHP
jgi:DUF4097 and DUF4098 domain-containing protein YvlB